MHFEVFIYPQRIQRGRIKTCQKHIDHDQDIDLSALYPHGQVFIVVLEFVRRGIEIRLERPVIIVDSTFQKIARGLIQRFRIEALFRHHVLRVCLICCKAENGSNRQLALLFSKLALELRVILHRHRYRTDGKDRVEPRRALSFEGIKAVALCLLVEVLQRVADDLFNALWRAHRLLNINGSHLRIFDVGFFSHRVDVVDAERQHIAVIDGVHDRISVKLIAKGLRCSTHIGISAGTGIDRKNRRTRKPEQVIILERLGDSLMHVAELAAVALIEDDDKTLLERGMSFVFTHEDVELLNGRDDDMYVRVAHLPLEDGGARVAVGRSLFKAVILFHRLIVEVFSVHYEQHLVDILQAGRQLRCLKGGQRLAAAGCVPDIAACFNRTALLVGRRNLDAVEDALRRSDLIWAHHQQQVFRRKHAVAGQDIQQRVLGKKRLGEVDQIRNDLVVGVCPERGEFKAVAGLFALVPPLTHLLDVAAAGGVGIILRVRAVGNDKYLHILIKTAGRPKAVALVALDLVERLADGDTAALEFDMYHGQAIDQHRHVIAHIVRASALLILVDDLKEVIVNILFVDEIDIFRRAAVLPQHLHMVVLDLARLFHDALVGTGNAALEKALPLRIGEGVVVQLF